MEIDFVITWVNGSDPNWLEEFYKYKKEDNLSTHEVRFRDWENLHFWFRGIERFAPWVRNVYIITWGHIPEWLNTEHPKLKIVTHQEFIPQIYLPTFNSRTIELNIHRIEGLSNHYVYFNDDTFILDKLEKIDFFKNGLICDTALLRILSAGDHEPTLFRNIHLINKKFSKRRTVKEKPYNWFNFKYSFKDNRRNLLLTLPFKRSFPGFRSFHLPQPLRKQTLSKLWEEVPEVLDEACRYTFRDYFTVNNYIQRDWELASNQFVPINRKKQGEWLSIQNTPITYILDYISNQYKPMICINDHVRAKVDFEKTKQLVKDAFLKILPEKSSFEL